jgi:glycosyltransferase involved in cell wall biosynthesis
MRIGFVIYGSLETLSGGYLYDRKLVEYLRAQGDTVEIISLPWRNYAAHLSDNLAFKLPINFDILIQDELNHPSLIAANARKRPRPVVSLVHHLRCSELRPKWQNALYRIVEKKYLQSVDGFIFNSQTTEKVVNGLMVNGKPSIVAYPPTDRFGDVISEEEIKARASGEPFHILFLGNVIERKGLHTLLKALFNLHPFDFAQDKPSALRRGSGQAFCLDIVGSLTTDPAYVKVMQKQVAVNGLSSIVRFHGALDNNSLKQIIMQAHLLVVPSSYEGFGIAYLEGMAFGLPAIGTTAGAASEIITDGETGYLIEPNDSKTLALRLTSLAKNRDLLARMSVNALMRYQAQPKWEQTAQQIREFLFERIGK